MATTIASAANLCALHVMQDDTVQAAPVAGAAPAAAPTPPGQLITAFIQAILSLLNAGTLCGNVPATLQRRLRRQGPLVTESVDNAVSDAEPNSAMWPSMRAAIFHVGGTVLTVEDIT